MIKNSKNIFIIIIFALVFSSSFFSISCKDENINPTQSPVSQTTSETNGNRMGVLIVYLDPGIDEARAESVLEAARISGAKWVRMGLIWALANPQKDSIDFSQYDWIFNKAIEKGLSVVPVISWTPQWASSKPNDSLYVFYPPCTNSIGTYNAGLGSNGTGFDYLTKFADTLSKHYKGKIDNFEFWNEPDMNYYLRNPSGLFETAPIYAKMLAYFYSGIKQGNPSAKVVLGGLAQGAAAYGCDTAFLHKILSDALFPAASNYNILNFHTNFKNISEIDKQINWNLSLNIQYKGDTKYWITETSYTSEELYQNTGSYTDGENGLSNYLNDIILTGYPLSSS